MTENVVSINYTVLLPSNGDQFAKTHIFNTARAQLSAILKKSRHKAKLNREEQFDIATVTLPLITLNIFGKMKTTLPPVTS